MTSGSKHFQIPIIILAAGEGSRAAEITGNIPKGLKPFKRDTHNNLVLRCIQQLHSHGFWDFYIIAGASYDYYSNYLGQLKRNNKIPINDYSITLLDARSNWQKGPAFSFLAAQALFDHYKHVIVLPADTLFDPSIFSSVVRHFTLITTSHSPLLFAAPYTPLYSRPVRIIKQKKVWKKTPFSQLFPDTEIFSSNKVLNAPKSDRGSEYFVILPLMYITSPFFNFIQNHISIRENTLFKLFVEWIKSHVGHFLVLQHSSEWIFWDFDTPNDWNRILSLRQGE